MTPFDPPEWVAQYTGLPFKELGRTREGIDCWGLARLVLQEQLGLETPDYSEAYTNVGDTVTIPRVIAAGLEADWERVEKPKMFDLIILNIGRRKMHVGIVVAKHDFLHSPEGKSLSLVERFTDGQYIRRIEGFYRHVSRCRS